MTAAMILAVALLGSPGGAQEVPERTTPVLVAEYDGIIHPIAAEFLTEWLDRADRSNAAAAVLILRTPGGLLDSTRAIVSRIIAARTPVVVFVAPSGARAASAGFLITLAADVAAMSPGTHIGAAHPVSAQGPEGDGGTLEEKAAADAAAYARTLASTRGRNVKLAEEAVLESRAFTDQEALSAQPPLIDLVAHDLDDLLQRVDGREVKRSSGGPITLRTAGAAVERVEMTRRQRLLSAIAHPQIAALLLTLGMLGLVVELWNPGAIAPGVVGGICLLLAFFAFQILPVNVTGMLLMALGIGLLVVEVTVPSFGMLGVGGIVALAAGALMVTNEVPGVSVGYGSVLAMAVAAGGIVLVLGRLAIAAHRQGPATGVEAMTGEYGRTLTATAPDTDGQVSVHGEIWRARSHVPIAADVAVRVLAVKGLTLSIEPAATSDEGGAP
jgi:membrane-bound serine protease (ClpP class)